MPARSVCCSHSPLMLVDPLGDEREQRLQAGFERAARRIAAFAPEVIVCFAPDHFNGFFYDLMPPFCIGAAAAGVGDYRSLQAELRVPKELAERCVQAAFGAGVDAAISYAMRVDHGAAQALEFLTGALDRYPVVPVFINAAAPPRPALARAAALGRAIGAQLERDGVRALFLGSGGLSHDPPIAKLDGADDATRAMLLDRRGITPEARVLREARVRAAGAAARRGEIVGRPLNPQWDRAFLELVSGGSPEPALALDDDAITAEAGSGGHEIRSWIAALSALNAAGGAYTADVLAFEPVTEWITSMAVLWAEPA